MRGAAPQGGVMGFAAPQGGIMGFPPPQGAGAAAAWTPLAFGSSLVDEWDPAAAYCTTDAGCDFESSSNTSLVKTSPTFSPTTAMTIRLSYKPESLATSHGLIGRYNGSDNQFLVYLLNTGAIYVYISASGSDSSNYVASSVTLSAGTQYEIAVVYDGSLGAASRVAIYIDGVDRTGTYTGTIPTSLRSSSADLTVGRWGASSDPADGIMQCAGVSSSALSGAALTAAHTATFYGNMSAARQEDWDVGFWNLCESDGARADSAGSNHLTAVNSPGYAAGVASGPVQDQAPRTQWAGRRNATNFTAATAVGPTWNASGLNSLPDATYDGTSQYEKYSGASGLDGSDKPFTFSVVLQKSSNGAAHAIFGLGATGGVTPWHGVFTTAAPVYSTQRQADGGGAAPSATGGTPDTDPHVVTVVFSGTTISVWVDGANVINEAAMDVGACTFDQYAIGALVRSTVSNYMAGDISHVVFTKHAASSTERASLESYLATKYGITLA